jgi:hypothetical protein
MNCDNASDLDYQQTEEETLTCEVSDDALEAASGTPGRGVPTLFHNTYCFGCPPSLRPMTGASFLAANVWSFCAEVAQS